MSSPKQLHPTQPELVQVDTALTVLSQVNLLRESNSLALDIGGSLAKLLYLQHHGPSKPHPRPLKVHLVDGTVATALSVYVPALGGTLHFFAFETRNISQLLRFIRQHWPQNTTRRKIRATGGGSYKYANTFQSEIDVTLVRLDEMKATVAGLNFLLTSVKHEVYTYKPPPDRSPRPAQQITRNFVDTSDNPFPYLLVNIGSGVSIVKVTGHDQFERVSGSSLGGGTFWGLSRMLLDCATFDDVIELTHKGDNSNVDMLVGDIYGGAYPSIDLDSSIIAASFGKATMREEYIRHPSSVLTLMKERFARACVGSYHLWLSFLLAVPGLGPLLRTLSIGATSERPPALITHTGARYRPQDVALSLLRMVSYNIGQIAYLNARVHNLDRIYFGGNFIRNHPFTIADISFAVDFWSGGKTKALFLRHDGYLGAIGAFIGGSSATPTTVIENGVDNLPDLNGVLSPQKQESSRVKNGMMSTSKSSEEKNDRQSHNESEEAQNTPKNPEEAVNAVQGVFPDAKPDKSADHSATKRPQKCRKKRSTTRPSSEPDGAVVDQRTEMQEAKRPSSAATVSDPEGDWTTVTRARRKPMSKGKEVQNIPATTGQVAS